MNTKNLIHNVAFLYARIKSTLTVENLMPAVRFGHGAKGVEREILSRKLISTEEFLSILGLKEKIDINAFNEAVDMFMANPSALAHIDAKKKQRIVQALGFDKVYQLFEDKHFTCKGERGVDHVRELFANTKADERDSLLYGLMLYFSLADNHQYWTEENAELLKFMGQRIVDWSAYLGTGDPKLSTYLVDNWGLSAAFLKMNQQGKVLVPDDKRFVDVMDHASETGIRTFLGQNLVAASPVRLKDIERLLFIKNKPTLLTFVSEIGCRNADVERHLLFIDKLPEESVVRTFVFPQNFTALMDKFGQSKVQALLSKEYQDGDLERWIAEYLDPKAKVTRSNNVRDWEYVLADDVLCEKYLAGGGKFTEDDISKLLIFGKDAIIAKIRK